MQTYNVTTIRQFTIIAALFLLAAMFNLKLDGQTSTPTGTDVPRILIYQGQVTTTDGSAMNGTHHITTTLYSDRFGTNSVWHGDYSAEVANGVFNILLGSGNAPLPEVPELNRPLWVGIRVDGGDEMKPLTQLSAAPYAINISDQSVTMAKLAPDVQSAIFGAAGHTPSAQNVGGNVLLGGQAFGGGGAGEGDEWIGSNNNFGVWFKTDGIVAMRYIPTGSTPNIIGGYSGNSITGSGSVICGGGSSGSGNSNSISSNYSGIASGKHNTIGSNSNNSFILGGSTNNIGNYVTGGCIGAGAGCTISDSCSSGTINGGSTNIIQDGVTENAAQYATIPGGDHLTAQSYAQTVIGHYNTALGGSTPSAITGTDPLLIVGNGTSTTRSNAFEVFNNGTSVVHHDNGTGEIYSQVIGGTHKDNIIYAWGVVEDNEIKHIIGVTDSVEDFGVLSFAHTAAGTYVIQLNLVDPDTYAATTLQYGAVTAISYDVAVGCAIFKTSEITTVGGVSQFTITTTIPTVEPASPPHSMEWLDCVATDLNFMFIVTGRP